jgi:hypothetical protein
MIESVQIEKEIDAAIKASTDLLSCLEASDWEQAGLANEKRMSFIRLLSKRQKNSHMWQKFDDKINKLKHLDKEILKLGKVKHAQMLLLICDNNYKTSACVAYAQNK